MVAGLTEYCQWEQLEISCDPGEVIMMSGAYYGRMQYGRCIRRDYGYVGCYADVRALADTRCSGRRSCRISVPDKLFDGTTPCPEDLKLYLMAGYTCVKGCVIVVFPVDCLYRSTLCSVWLGSLTVTCRTCNPEVTQRRRFDSAPGHCRVTTLGKLFTHMCTKHYNLVPASPLGRKQAHRAIHWPRIRGLAV